MPFFPDIKIRMNSVRLFVVLCIIPLLGYNGSVVAKEKQKNTFSFVIDTNATGQRSIGQVWVLQSKDEDFQKIDTLTLKEVWWNKDTLHVTTANNLLGWHKLVVEYREGILTSNQFVNSVNPLYKMSVSNRSLFVTPIPDDITEIAKWRNIFFGLAITMLLKVLMALLLLLIMKKKLRLLLWFALTTLFSYPLLWILLFIISDLIIGVLLAVMTTIVFETLLLRFLLKKEIPLGVLIGYSVAVNLFNFLVGGMLLVIVSIAL